MEVRTGSLVVKASIGDISPSKGITEPMKIHRRMCCLSMFIGLDNVQVRESESTQLFSHIFERRLRVRIIHAVKRIDR